MGIIRNGICGTCVWELNDEMTLTIRPRNGKNGVLRSNSDSDWPWRPCCHIRRVVIEDGVKTGTYAGRMFAGMADCAEFDVSALDVSAAKNMHGMFEDCCSLEDITALKKWDVSKAVNMSCIFADCSSLKDISALAGWNTSRVIDMHRAFCICSSLTDISALAGWNTSRVIDMCGMFEYCNSLENISPLKKWNISNVANTCYMFRSCESLTDISPLSGWDVSGIRKKDGMFTYAGISCDALDTFIPMVCPKEGAFIGYKKCRGGRIVQLEIPEDAERSSAYGEKCRCSKAKVLNIWTADGKEAGYAVSHYDETFFYCKGSIVEVSDFDPDRFVECGPGIHFFIEKNEALNYICR